MKTFIVTAYSGKNEGRLYVIKAESDMAAMQEVADKEDLTLMYLSDVDYGGYYMVYAGRSEADLRDELRANANVRWSFRLFADELAIGKNHSNAVCW